MVFCSIYTEYLRVEEEHSPQNNEIIAFNVVDTPGGTRISDSTEMKQQH